MKRTLTFFLLVLCSNFIVHAQTWDNFKWEKRILILAAPSLKYDGLAAQLKVLEAKEEALQERDLLLFLWSKDGIFTSHKTKTTLSAEDARKRWHIRPGFTGLLLIGKDGGVKLKRDFVVKPMEIFDLIDGMPMRKAEMRRAKEN